MATTRIEPLPNTPMIRAMAVGHLKRKGHELQAHYLNTPGKFSELVYDCCESQAS